MIAPSPSCERKPRGSDSAKSRWSGASRLAYCRSGKAARQASSCRTGADRSRSRRGTVSDYIVKPFSPSELGARIRAALRKRRPADLPEPAEPYVLGDLALNFMERRVTVAGRPVVLTATEYGLLVELAANPGRVITNVLERIWGAGQSAGTAPVRRNSPRIPAG